MIMRVVFCCLSVLLSLAGRAMGASPPEARAHPLTLTRFLASAGDDFGEPVEEKEKTVEDFLGTDQEATEQYKARVKGKRDLEREKHRQFQAIERYASKRLKNLRFALTVFSMLYREMKEGSAGWGHYDDLFESGILVTRIHINEASVYVPTGGFEISFVGAPFYHMHFGMSYDVFTGRHFLGNEFADFLITSYYIGLRFNLLNEYTATQQFKEMFEYMDPPHITGLNIYLKGHVGLCILNRVLVKGNFTGPGDPVDTYFNQTQTFGYYIGAGFEYRFLTIGLFFETGWSYIRHPNVARPLVTANHFRSFPVMAGINVYFGN